MANSKWSVVSERRQEFVNALIEDMEKGEIPWEKPWASIAPPLNAATGKTYHGANSLMLGYMGYRRGYADPRWCTFNQAKENGWNIKPGSKADFVEYWDWYNRIPVLDENGKQKIDEGGKKVFKYEERERPLCVSHAVFNASQIDGIPPYEKHTKWNSIEDAENILKNSGAVISHRQTNRAYYSPINDMIILPHKEQFKSKEGYYGTALHELGHWTGHEKRMNRDMTGRLGTPEYAKEELKAELASAFLNSELGVKKEFSDCAAYLKSWIKTLKDDKDEFYAAARDAEKIANYILEFAKEKELTQEVKPEFDKDLIRRANDASALGNMGDIIVNYHKTIKEKIVSFNLSDSEKENALKKITALTQEELSTQANNPSWVVTGRANYNTSKGIKGAEKVSKLKSEIHGIADDLERKSNKNNVRDSDQRFLSALKEAEGNGLKETEFEGKKYIKRGKSWVLAPGQSWVLTPGLTGEKANTKGGIMDAKVNVNQAEQAQPDTLLGHLAEGVKETLSQDILADDTLVGYATANVKDSLNNMVGTKPEGETKKMQDTDGKPAPCDIRLNVSYDQKTPAKELGAKWDKDAQTWFVPKGEDLSKFTAYLPQDGKMYALRDTPITVDYNARDTAKEKGAWWNTETKSWYIPKGSEVTKYEQKYFEPAPEKLKVVTKTFEDFAREKGLIIDEAIGDGKMHRVAVEGGKHGSKDGAYLVYDDDKGRAGYVQNFKTGEKATFAEKGESFTLSETDKAEIAKAVEKHKAEIQVRQDSKAKSAAYLTEFKFTQAEASHPYLQAKGVQPHGTRFDTEGKLIVPLKNINGETRSWQTIETSGAKHFLPDGQISGCFHQVGNANLKNSKDIIICEGFATGASLHEATNKPVLCAMQAGNLKNVAVAVREKYGDKTNIIIAGDNDHKQSNNLGRTAAEDAAKAVNGKVITPEFTPKEKEKGLSDFNDLAVSRGKAAVKDQLSTAMTHTKHNEQQLCG
jgi:antirestriction protein ArdC/phage/plasmid primase-like uncharacterized protein